MHCPKKSTLQASPALPEPLSSPQEPLYTELPLQHSCREKGEWLGSDAAAATTAMYVAL